MTDLRILTKDKRTICGYCGKPIRGNSGWGVGWTELPFVLFGKLVSDGPGADAITEGVVLVVMICNQVCRRRYIRTAEGLGLAEGIDLEFTERVFIPYKAMAVVPSKPGMLQFPAKLR